MFASVSVELNHNRPPWVLDSYKCVSCDHPSSSPISVVPDLFVTWGGQRLTILARPESTPAPVLPWEESTNRIPRNRVVSLPTFCNFAARYQLIRGLYLGTTGL